ncbi:MAG TPA: hypothetical protein VKU80_08930, partial [Planctomycetota bacterium]|nr:hypothetical protein [Planctomycetota bacterium]
VLIEEYEVQLDEEKGSVASAGKGSTPAPSEAEQEVLFIQSRLQVAAQHLRNGNKHKAIDVLEDLTLSYPKHPLQAEIKRLLEEAKKE